MLLKRFYYERLAHASYMIGCQVTKEAIVVDAHRDTDLYVRAAEAEGLRIRFVTETHIHADYLSGSRQLARQTGAELILSGEGDETWQYAFGEHEGARIVRDGDEIRLGNVVIGVLHTPGHTPEHLSFSVTDGASASVPMGMLTGDFIFVGDVGRPDLLEKAAGFADTMEAGARVLYASLQRIRSMPGYTQILPGHGAGSACGKALGAVPSSTLGYELLVNWAFQCGTEEEFIRKVLEDQPEPPVYFAEMKRMNRDGPAILDGMPSPKLLSPERVFATMEGDGVVLDVRPREHFAAGHLPGSLSAPLGDDFTATCGWHLSYDRPLSLLAEGSAQAEEAARALAYIGLDDVVGYFDVDAFPAWERDRGGLQATDIIAWPEAERAAAEEGAFLLDVRGRTEWAEGHAPGAGHIHYGVLRRRADELPRDRPIVVYCQAGGRSAIAAALLQAEGFEDVRNVRDGMNARKSLGLPVETG